MDNLENERLAAHVEEGVRRLSSLCGKLTIEMLEKSKVRLLLEGVWTLSIDERIEFFETLGESTVAENVWLLIGGLNSDEMFRFCVDFGKSYNKFQLPKIIESILETYDFIPDDKKQSMLSEIEASVREKSIVFGKEAFDLVQSYVENKRNRKSTLENIKRNVEICDLRINGWSQGQIAKKYGKTDTWVRNIEKDELKWRRLLAQSNRTK